jgi:hypothetical protein
MEIIDGDLFSIQFIYRYGDKARKQDIKERAKNENVLNFIAGVKWQVNRHYYDPNKQDNYNRIATTPEIGLEYYFSKTHKSIDIRRNVWLSIAAGDPRYGISGYSEQLFTGANHYKFMENGKALKLGLSHVLMRDLTVFPVQNGRNFIYYPEKGIAASIGYPVRNIDIEARGIYAYYIHPGINSKVVNPFDTYRISIGAVYRFNPLRK